MNHWNIKAKSLYRVDMADDSYGKCIYKSVKKKEMLWKRYCIFRYSTIYLFRTNSIYSKDSDSFPKNTKMEKYTKIAFLHSIYLKQKSFCFLRSPKFFLSREIFNIEEMTRPSVRWPQNNALPYSTHVQQFNSLHDSYINNIISFRKFIS